jgi:hypothetical protein
LNVFWKRPHAKDNATFKVLRQHLKIDVEHRFEEISLVAIHFFASRQRGFACDDITTLK